MNFLIPDDMPDKKLTDNELKAIRQNVACPQFGDDHYGAWGALSINQRKAIYRMWDEINRQKAEIEKLNKELQVTRQYIHDNGLEWDLLSKSKKQKCDCYHTETKRRCTYNPVTGDPIGHDIEVGVCWGTQECDECSCGGDESKCDFYPKKRNGG